MTGLPVYLVHWNAPDWIASSIASILRSDLEVNIQVIDNGPSAASEALQPIEGVVFHPTGSNRGYAGAANIGIRHWLTATTSEYCIVGSHDLHVQPDTLRQLVEAADAHPDCGILSPDVGGQGELLGSDGDLEYRRHVSGTCLLLRRSCIEQIGGFDEEFHSYTEDREIGWRANDQGWKVGRLTTAQASGLGSIVENPEERFLANRVLLARKREGPRAALLHLLRHLAQALRHLVLSIMIGERGRAHWRLAGRHVRVVGRAAHLLHDHRRH